MEFIVEGANWTKEIKIENDFSNKYKDKAFEAMTRAMDEITATEIIKLGSPIPKKTKDQIKKDKNLQSKIAGGAIYFDIDENAYSVVNKETGKRESIDDINQVITLKEDGIIL